MRGRETTERNGGTGLAAYINWVEREPDYGSLPAAKIIDYPLEERDYRPFAQAQLALGPSSLFVRLIAFETHPDPESRMGLLLRLLKGCFWLSASAGGELQLLPDMPVQQHRIAGEDLQGIFWGMECALPRARLEALLGAPLGPGVQVQGNILKTGVQPEHFGCLYPCRPVYSPEGLSALEEKDFGPFCIVGY